jgi:proteasome lid subunit RPN8/RPN11
MGLEVVAIYHSHPGGTATLSPLDRFFARPDVTHIVVAVNSLDADAEILRAYRCEEEKVMEVPILIVE